MNKVWDNVSMSDVIQPGKGNKGQAVITGRGEVKMPSGAYPGQSYTFKGKTSGKSHTIDYDSNGFPDFSGHINKEVSITQTGKRDDDFRLANLAAGYGDNAKNPTIDGVQHTWHHHQDGKTMQLIPTDVHGALNPHTGGVAVVNSAKTIAQNSGAIRSGNFMTGLASWLGFEGAANAYENGGSTTQIVNKGSIDMTKGTPAGTAYGMVFDKPTEWINNATDAAQTGNLKPQSDGYQISKDISNNRNLLHELKNQ